MTSKFLVLSSLALFTVASTAAAAPIRPSHRHEAGHNKMGKYATEGYFIGGDRTVTSAKLLDIRRAKSNDGFERIVLDLAALGADRSSVPYFQVTAAPEEGRFVLSIWANVLFDFEPAKINKTFAKSAHFKKVSIMPRLEEGLTIIEFALNPEFKGKPKFEVFRLASPARIIMDVL